MSTMKHLLRFVAVLIALGVFTGCESTDGGSSSSSVGVYYGVGFYSPYYYGDYDHDYDIDVSPPDRPDRPDRPGAGARPEQPLARPPEASPRSSTVSERPAARSTPSIPSTPRAAPRGGGGGGGRR